MYLSLPRVLAQLKRADFIITWTYPLQQIDIVLNLPYAVAECEKDKNELGV